MPYPRVPLSRIAKPVSRPVVVIPGTKYRTIGVKWWGEGAYERETIDGAETAAKTLSIVHKDDLIINKIWVRHGSTAIASDDVHGCAASGEFPTFELDQTQVLPRWLHWLTKTQDFWKRCDILSRGSSGKNRIKPELFLTIEIPLPETLDEQRRVIHRIEEVAERIKRGEILTEKARTEANSVFLAELDKIWNYQAQWKFKPIGKLSKLVSGQVDPRLEPYASLPHISGDSIETGTCRLLNYRLAKEDGVTSGKYHFQPGTILYSKIRPYLRKAVQVPVEGICSADIYAFENLSDELEPRFFMYSLISPPFTSYANNLSGRTRIPKINQLQLNTYELGYPLRTEQKNIVSHLDNLQVKLVFLDKQQREKHVVLAALLPSILDKAFRGEL